MKGKMCRLLTFLSLEQIGSFGPAAGHQKVWCNPTENSQVPSLVESNMRGPGATAGIHGRLPPEYLGTVVPLKLSILQVAINKVRVVVFANR